MVTSPSSGVAIGLFAVAWLFAQEAHRAWQGATAPEIAVVPPAAEAFLHAVPTLSAPPVSGFFEQARTALLGLASGVAFGLGLACHLWLRFGRGRGTEVHLAVGTSVVVEQHEGRQAVLVSHRRRLGRGVLEGSPSRQ